MKQTVKIVRPNREFETKDGNKLVSIEVTFADGSDGSVIVNPKNADAARGAMEKLVNTEAEFDLEPKADYNARKQWKIKGYPGKPGGGGFGGGKPYVDNSPSIEAQNAVNNAVRLVAAFSGDVGNVADAMARVMLYAPQLHALTQSLKNGKPPAAQPVGANRESSLSGQAPAAPAVTWEEIEVRASGGGSTAAEGEAAVEAPLPGPSGGEPGKTPTANGSSPDLTALWDEASALDLTKARVVSVLKKAGQPVMSWEDVDERQLESILGPLRRVNA